MKPGHIGIQVIERTPDFILSDWNNIKGFRAEN